MDLTEFQASTHTTAPPPAISLPLQALWWEAKGDWDKAHACAQADTGPMGAAVHAYLHRKEPDLSNAGYWYRRAGRAPATGALDEEWKTLAIELLRARPEETAG